MMLVAELGIWIGLVACGSAPPRTLSNRAEPSAAHVDAVGDVDGDGIESFDGCDQAPEDFDGFADSDGCPDPDNDRDDILDVDDMCPNEPETRNQVDDFDGCPDPWP